MTRSQFLTLIGAVALALSASVYSQSPAAPGARPVPAAPAAPSIDLTRALQQLQAMKAQNAKTLDRQNALLLKLDELGKETAQMKFLSKRG
jgi:hypothetical protein